MTGRKTGTPAWNLTSGLGREPINARLMMTC